MTSEEEAADLLNITASYLYDVAQYPEAEPLYQRALAIRERVLGAEHPDTASSLNNLAILYAKQGKYEKAEPLLPARPGHLRTRAGSRAPRNRRQSQ